jgi:predicted nuclease of predicted toxin-antitoxin system
VKVKLDENVPRSAGDVLVAAGHDVDTVVDEDLAGATDPRVVAAAAATGRLLITLDRGLGDIRAYPPGQHAGILVLRPADQSASTVAAALAELVAGHDLSRLTGHGRHRATRPVAHPPSPVAKEPRSFRATRLLSDVHEPELVYPSVGDPRVVLVPWQ